MASESSEHSGGDLEIVKVDELVLEIFEAILRGENLWRQPDSPVDTSVHLGRRLSFQVENDRPS